MKKVNNQEIRGLIKKNNILQWQIAEKIGITDGTLTVWLRLPLTPERREKILSAIEELKNE